MKIKKGGTTSAMRKVEIGFDQNKTVQTQDHT